MADEKSKVTRNVEPAKPKPDVVAEKAQNAKPIVWLRGEVRTPPFSAEARVEAGQLLRQIQEGVKLGMPQSRPMPQIESGCHELRLRDADKNWRLIYSLEEDAIVILDVFNKTTNETPEAVKAACKRRLAAYRTAVEGP